MGKFKIKTDRIIAFSAMSISLMTLMIFIYQTNLIREQNRLSVTPRLSFNEQQLENDSTTLISFEMRNNGLGPAIVDSIAILYQGKRYKADYRSFFSENTLDLYQYVKIPNTVLTSPGESVLAGERLPMFVAEVQNQYRQMLAKSRKDGELKAFDVEVYYSSIYQEQWKIRLKSPNSVPQPVD